MIMKGRGNQKIESLKKMMKEDIDLNRLYKLSGSKQLVKTNSK